MLFMCTFYTVYVVLACLDRHIMRTSVVVGSFHKCCQCCNLIVFIRFLSDWRGQVKYYGWEVPGCFFRVLPE